jgi:glycosyltransferase involved in cell wall biosynthesis
MNILVIDRAPPVGTTQGNVLIGHHLFPRLAAHRLVLVAPVTPEAEADRAELLRTFAEVHLVERNGTPPAMRGWFEASTGRWGARGLRLDADFATRFRARIRAVLSGEAFDAVHVRQLPMAPYGEVTSGVGRLLELIDSETLAARRALPRTGARRARAALASRIERRAMEPYDITTTVGSADLETLRELRPDRRVELVPNGVDAATFQPLPDVAEDPATIVFSGAMSFPPNVAAAEFLVREILPLVQASVPDARVVIAGRDPIAAVQALAGPRVEVTGRVPDLRPYLARATVVASPMVSGSGVKNKVLEAMAMGRPLAGTPLAVEGLDVEPGLHVAVGEGAEGMARQIVALLGDADARRRMGQAARERVAQRYTWEACAATYESLYRDLAAITKARRAASA